MNRSLLRRGMVAAAVAAGTAALTLTAVLPATASAAVTTAARPAAPRVRTVAAKAVPAWSDVLVNCQHKGVVMPSSYILSCADGYDYLSSLHWSYWHAMANGWGWEHINECQPTCVAGKWRKFRVLVTAWRQRMRAHRVYKYTRLTVIYTHSRPLQEKNGKKHHPQTTTFHLP